MMDYRHGNYISEVPTSLVPPVTVDSAMPVFFVKAPVHLTKDPYGVTNVPKRCYSYAEAAEAFGISLKPEIWGNYTACEAIYSQFMLYGVAPVVIVNVLDPKEHNRKITDEKVKLTGYSGVLPVDGVLIDTVSISGYEAGKDYTLAFDKDGFIEINAIKNADGGIAENAELSLSYTALDPEKCDIYDCIGGYDFESGKSTGLELVNEIYPRFRLVPGQIVAPGFSADPAVAAVMETKAANINGVFRCIAITDIPTVDESGEKLRYTDAPAWKNENGYTSARQYNCYPMVRMGEQIFHLSTHIAGLICRTDAENSGTPYNSPSNKSLKINGLCYEDGEEVVLGIDRANYLNGQGIATANNFSNGWTAWGNRTGAYPGNTDIKDTQISVRRMFDWIGNTVILTFFKDVDYPLTPRAITTITDSVNIWFNGLASREFILGGRIEFLPSDNPDTDLINGARKFRLKIAPPPAAEVTEFIMEYDPSYLQVLFASA